MKYLGYLFLFVLIFSCQKFSWNNPFDPECPKDLFTPENFTAQQESKSIRISWQQSNTQISGFEISRSVDGSNNLPLVSLGKEATSFVDTDVQADKQYKYFILAKAGDNKSNELTTIIVFKVQPPIAPENLNAIVISASKVQLQWVDRSTEETGFKVERKSSGGNYGLIATLTSNTTNYSDSTVAEGQSYVYRVYAFNQGGNSLTYSNEVEIAVVLLPQITTVGVSNITFNSASSGGSNILQNGSPITAKGIVWSTARQPTIALSTKTNNGSGSANYSSEMTGLAPGTTYYVRAYATNQVGTAYGADVSFTTEQTTTSPTDVTIGTQVWQSKNLDVVTYRNGDIIPQITDPKVWGELTTGAWCWYDNNSANGSTYGRLYNWYAVTDPRGLAPAGYHIPSDAEWTILTNFLGGESVAGGKMKSTSIWQNPNAEATNSSGFNGLPGGYRNIIETFNQIGVVGDWWSSTEYDTALAWFRYLSYNNGIVGRIYARKTDGLSVRCIRD